MPERTARSETVGTANLDETGRTTDEKAEKPDRYGEWLADDARIWRVYGQLAKEDDKEKVQRWSGGLNNLAVFATLFSGITTAFIIESQGDLKPDFAELAYRVQNATAHGRAYVEEPFVVPGQARTVNCLWITSLLLSLSAALIAVMGQDWVEMYVDQPVCNPRQWAEMRSFRLNGVRRWYMPGVIATAPVLLHASLFLFGIGLAVFMASDLITQNLCVALCAIIAFLYAITMFSAVLWSSSPFRSPATMLLRRWFCARFQREVEKDPSLTEDTAVSPASPDTAAPGWIHNRLIAAWAAFSRIVSPYGSVISDFCTTASRRWSRAASRRDPNRGVSLPHAEATHDTETPASTSEPRRATPRWLQNSLAWFRTTVNPVVAQYVSSASNAGTRVFRRWFSPVFRRARSPDCWTSKCRAACGRILDNSRPDVSNGWLDILEKPSPALVADSLSWLSSASSSPEVARLVVAGLCDHVTGLEVGRHRNARGLIEKLSQHAEHNWEQMSLLELCRHVLVFSNADWPLPPDGDRRLMEVMYPVTPTETPLSQDVLLALAYITRGFRVSAIDSFNTGASSFAYMRGSRTTFTTTNFLDQLEQLCARILVCSPGVLELIVSITTPRESSFTPHPVTAGALITIVDRWSDVLPDHLGPIERTLRAIVSDEVVERMSTLSNSCTSTVAFLRPMRRPRRNPKPVDNLIHWLIAFFLCQNGENLPVRSTLHLVLVAATEASYSRDPYREHTQCLAALFGSSCPNITRAAWRDLPARDELALDRVVSRSRTIAIYGDHRRMLARMTVRRIWPPLRLLASNGSAGNLLSCGVQSLGPTVESLYIGGAVPDDLFRPVFEQHDLVGLTKSLHDGADSARCGENFFSVLGAIAFWIVTRRDPEDRLALFESFTVPQTMRGSNGGGWDLVEAIGVALAQWPGPSEDALRLFCYIENFLDAMEKLREVFPERRQLWEDIARTFGRNRSKFSEKWPSWREYVRKATGIDSGEFADEASPRDTGTAPAVVLDAAESATNARMRTIAWIAAGAVPEQCA